MLDAWPKEGPPIAWQTKGLGSGFSSVAVAGNQVFSLGEADGQGFMICLDRQNGTEIWRAAFGKRQPNGTPTIDHDRVYGISRDGVLACVARDSGKIIWQVSFQDDFGGKEPTWGYSESPLVDGSEVIATPGSVEAHLIGLDKLTGDLRWEAALDPSAPRKGHGGAGYASPVISHAAGVKQYITLTGIGLVSINATTHKTAWIYDKISNGTANIPTPLVDGDYVLGSSGYGDGGTALLKISRDHDELNWKEIYYFSAKEKQNHHGGMILKDGHVFMGHGHNNGFPLCFDFLTGKDDWRPGRGPGRDSAAVAYADGHLYFRYQDATMALVSCTSKKYELKGQFPLAVHNRESWPHPVIAGGMLFIRDQDDLVVYDVRKK